MEQYIKKTAVVAEIEKKKKYAQTLGDNAINSSMQQFYDGMKQGCVDILSSIDTLDVKEVDLEKEYRNFIKSDNGRSMLETAKHFFELGLNASNPIAEENLESFVRQVIDLEVEAGEYYNNIIKEERKENRGSDLMINLLCGTIDAKELGIQYVLKKLKAQKGE